MSSVYSGSLVLVMANDFSLSPITPLCLAGGISYSKLLTGYCGQQRSQVSNPVNGILFYDTWKISCVLISLFL